MGLIDVHVDSQYITTVDCAQLPARFAERIGDKPLAHQLLFDSGMLSPGEHSLSITVRDGSEEAIGVGIDAFDFLESQADGQCMAPGETGDGRISEWENGECSAEG